MTSATAGTAGARGIRCGECGGRHATVEGVRDCHQLARALEAEAERHFCESPSCMDLPGCAAYRHDSAAAGYWGQGEREREEYAWALEEAAREAEYGAPPVF